MIRPAWWDQAACRGVDADVMFPPDGGGVAWAIRICGECPVRKECLEYALANNENHGVWGGTSERERRNIARRRRRRVA